MDTLSFYEIFFNTCQRHPNIHSKEPVERALAQWRLDIIEKTIVLDIDEEMEYLLYIDPTFLEE